MKKNSDISIKKTNQISSKTTFRLGKLLSFRTENFGQQIADALS